MLLFANTRPKDPAGLTPENDSGPLSYTPTFLSGSCGPPSCDSRDSCAGETLVEGVPALLCSGVVSAMSSAIVHAETWPFLPGGPSRNALHDLHAALSTARGR